MFRRVSNSKQTQNNAPDPEIREEQQAVAGGIGNEALSGLLNNDRIKNIPDDLSDLDGGEEIPPEIVEDGLVNYYQNDLKRYSLKRSKEDELIDLGRLSELSAVRTICMIQGSGDGERDLSDRRGDR